ncbi:metal-dependent hydrolase [Bifidobacterium avesanii]|nr:SprT family zinc-dependent metalloprotease [Bifidobacterium avesanii]KAB8292039.1 metal-dependent hydrolase [Bifidobacterium avesanii]
MAGIAVRLTRKPIKNLYVRVKPPDGRVEISAPMRMSMRRIEAFVEERREWILAHQRNVIAARERTLVGGTGDESAGAGDAATTWTDERAKEAARAINAALPGLLAHWGPIIGRTPTHVTLRVMRSRWGSCTPATGRIRLNLQLGLMEPRFLEYVLVHEMTHLWAGGHGEKFQRLMSSYLPNWRELRRELNRRVVL